MSCISYLFEHNSDQPPTAETPASSDAILAEGCDVIPIFWFTLFDKSNLIEKPYTFEDGSSDTCPYFVAPTAEAKARSRDRRNHLFHILPSVLNGEFEKWLKLLDTAKAPYLHVEPFDFWQLSPPDCLPTFESCLAAVNDDSTLTNNWRTLFSQAVIDPDGIAETAKPYLLWGHSFDRGIK